MNQQVAVKSTKLFEIQTRWGILHKITLILREYRGGRSFYILKTQFLYPNHPGRVIRVVYHSKDKALKALRDDIMNITIDGIDFLISLPC